MDPKKAGMAVGVFAGLMHIFWSALVLLGLAQGLLDFVFGLHFIENPYFVLDFELAKAGILVVASGAWGFFVGFLFATVWNWMKRG